MGILISLSVGLFIITSALVLPWVNRRRIHALQRETESLRLIIRRLKIAEMGEKEESPVPEQTPERPPLIVPQPQAGLDKATGAQAKEAEAQKPAAEERTSSSPAEAYDIKLSSPQPSFEQQFGARLPVWAGGIALALAGFFLVKYSIENNLMSPGVRVILGGMLGGAFLYAAEWVRSKPDFANGVRIAQSLSGAGIAVLYLSLFAATSLYQLIPYAAGFLGMAAVTALAVTLSLRHGPPIALLGLVGGFLTPALLGSGDPSVPALFLYLYFVFTGLMIVIARKNWWILSIPALLGAFLWVIVWMVHHFTPDDTLWLGLFLLAVSATIVVNSRHAYADDALKVTDVFALTSALNYIGVGGALILMGMIAGEAGFGALEWGLFGLLTLAGIALAYMDDRLYGFVPWLSMAVNVVMLFAWNTSDVGAYGVTLMFFALIYTGSGYALMSRARPPLSWAGLTAAAALGYYLLAYYKLHHTALATDLPPLFWGGAALLLAALAVWIVQEIRERASDHPQLEALLAIFAATATAFLSIGLTIELEREFLSVAFAAEMLAIAWINSRLPIKVLRPLCLVLACVFGFLLIPQVLLLVQLTAYSLVEAKLRLQESIPIVQWPLFQLGVPAVIFLGASYFLRRERDDTLVHGLELAAVALVAVMGYYLTRHAFHVEADILFVKAGFFERGVITNILFVYGLACFFIGRYGKRAAFSWSGAGLCAIALFRIAYFDLLLHNPLWAHQRIDGVLLFNSLLLPYGLPLLWSWCASRELSFLGRQDEAQWMRGCMLPLLFALISLNVRHFFHGDYLDGGAVTNAEIYSYSAVWLLLGIALLLAGTMRRDKMLRYASLGVMILTAAKVFLYDASELEGLYRVFSFFGLGLSLLALSWFYTRFVFGEDEQSAE